MTFNGYRALSEQYAVYAQYPSKGKPCDNVKLSQYPLG